jgi:transcription antitermination factor NusG
MTMPTERAEDPGGGAGWYIFRANAREEGLAEFNLRQQGFVHFLPKVLVTRRHARRYVTQREWLFPRYGFVSMDIARDRWRSVNGTRGVERLLMGPDGPKRVPKGVVEALQAATDADGLFSLEAGLVPGTMVRIRQGPLAGTLGVLQSLDSRGRVEVLLELMHGQVRAKVTRESIEISA